MNNEMMSINITNQTLRAGHEIYKIGNLTKIGKHVVRADNESKDGAVVWGSILIVASVGAIIFLQAGISIVGIVVGALLIFYGKNGRETDKFGLMIETNSGSNNLFFSENEQFIDKIIHMVHEIMDNEDTKVNYSVNIKEQKISNNTSSDNIHIHDSTNVAVKSESVSQSNSSKGEAEVEYLIDELLKKIRGIADSSDNAPNAKIRALETELRSEDLSRENAEKLWNDIVKSLPSLSKLTTSIEKILDTIFS